MSGCVQQEPDAVVRRSSVQLKRAEWGLSGSACGGACVWNKKDPAEIACVSFFCAYTEAMCLKYVHLITCVNLSLRAANERHQERRPTEQRGRLLIKCLSLSRAQHVMKSLEPISLFTPCDSPCCPRTKARRREPNGGEREKETMQNKRLKKQEHKGNVVKRES